MKKKAFVLLSALLIIILCVSCSYNVKDCAYAYFNNTAFLLVFNQSQNRLYKIELPLDLIVNYGKQNNLSTVPEAMEDFTGIKAAFKVNGTPDTYESLKRILECWMDDDNSEEAYLKTIVLHSQDLSKDPLSSKITKLCGVEVKDFLKHLYAEGIKTAYIDCDSFLNYEDPQYSKSYFRKWVKQVMGD